MGRKASPIYLTRPAILAAELFDRYPFLNAAPTSVLTGLRTNGGYNDAVQWLKPHIHPDCRDDIPTLHVVLGRLGTIRSRQVRGARMKTLDTLTTKQAAKQAAQIYISALKKVDTMPEIPGAVSLALRGVEHAVLKLQTAVLQSETRPLAWQPPPQVD